MSAPGPTAVPLGLVFGPHFDCPRAPPAPRGSPAALQLRSAGAAAPVSAATARSPRPAAPALQARLLGSLGVRPLAKTCAEHQGVVRNMMGVNNMALAAHGSGGTAGPDGP
ncbi:hypothetical protein MDA_GLEAN10009388 [Myotis davidii]|uniref:Uncharacterized protein n=1 Tax=Myotis davidii TaxID=225400 RepID=L5LFD0_MYODS|nr:hypothetical protein MDA_GLEAN10009388 [Myotis davidii]